jgi:chromosome segregation ATPase
MDEELAKKLDSDLQQIKHGSAQIQSLSTENRALNSLAIGQGAAIRTQSDLINQLQGQLRDHGHNLEQAVSYWEQCERDVLMNSQEVARLEERIAALTVDSDMAQSASRLNRRHAQAREDRLRSALQAIEVHLSETQTSLCVSKESSIRQHEFFLSELETYAKQLDHWKTAAEQFGTKALDSERDVLNLRKELGVAYRNAREAKEQLESQTTVLGERDATIRSLDRELADVRDQVQNAQYEIESLRSDLESVDAAWKPLDSVDGFELTDKLPAILGWRGWLTEGTPDAPAMFVLRPQLVPHSPDMSIEELICASSSPSSQSTPAPSTEILSCSNSHVIQPTDIDDPFLDSFLPQPCSQLSGISHTPRDATTSFAALRSHLNNAEIINELREQLADELLTRALIEDQVTRLQMKLLATEAVVVVQRRQLSSQQSQLSNQQSQLSNQQSQLSNQQSQLSNQQSQLSTQQSQLSSQQSQLSSQQSQLSEEAAKNASLCEQSRSLVVERDAMAARIAVLEAGLVDRQAEEMAAAKAADEVRAELEQAKQTLSAYVNESRSLVAERNAIAERIAVLEAGVVDRQAEETAAAEAANEVHAELEQTKKILRAYVKESRSLVVERNAMAERIAVLEAGLVERQAEEIAAAKAADEVRAELKQTKKTLRAYTKESRSLVVERNAMAARIAVLEAGLAEREVEEMAAAKAADEVHAELEQTKQTLRAYVKESRSLVVERDAMAERIAVLEAGLVERQAEEMAAAAKAADEVHAELEQTKQTLRAYVKESRSLVAERDAMAERIAALEAVLVERQAEEMAAAKAADEVQAELEQTKETLYACVNEVDAVKTERDELDMRLSQAIFLSTALQDKVATLEQKIANAVVTPSNGPLI